MTFCKLFAHENAFTSSNWAKRLKCLRLFTAFQGMTKMQLLMELLQQKINRWETAITEMKIFSSFYFSATNFFFSGFWICCIYSSVRDAEKINGTLVCYTKVLCTVFYCSFLFFRTQFSLEFYLKYIWKLQRKMKRFGILMMSYIAKNELNSNFYRWPKINFFKDFVRNISVQQRRYRVRFSGYRRIFQMLVKCFKFLIQSSKGVMNIYLKCQGYHEPKKFKKHWTR